jgi:plastocyanin
MQRLTAAAAVAASLVVSSCGGGGGSSPTNPSPTPTPTPTPNALTITITSQNGSQSFSPNPASAGGQLVVFRNADTIPHRVQLNDGSIDTGTIAPGATSSAVMMPTAGTHYHCTLHPAMTGAVSGMAGDPPPCVGIYCDPNAYY